MKINSFEEFLTETEVKVPSLSTSENFLSSIFGDAKKRKEILKAGVERSLYLYDNWDRVLKASSGWVERIIPDGSEYNSEKYNGASYNTWMFLTHEKKYFESVLLTKKEYSNDKEWDLNPARILVASSSPFKISDLDSIFVSTVTGHIKNTIYTFSRKIAEDHSQSNSPLEIQKNRMVREYTKVNLYYVVFEYNMKKSEGENVTFDVAKNSQAFKDLLEKYPVEIVSNPNQIKNGTIVLAIPSKYVIDPDNKFLEKGKDYLDAAYCLTKFGYVQKTSMDNPSAYYQKSGNFNSSTLEGWKDGFKRVEELFDKLKQKMYKEGARLISDPSERDKYRGLIAAHTFGI